MVRIVAYGAALPPQRTENSEQRTERAASARRIRHCAKRRSRRPIRPICPICPTAMLETARGTADFADWSRLGAGCRRLTARMGNADSADLGRLRACYRTQDCQNNWKSQRTRRPQRKLYNWRLWGAAPRPGREKFSLHPRHVCDVPGTTDDAFRKTREAQGMGIGSEARRAER